jgi:hypothetical protein
MARGPVLSGLGSSLSREILELMDVAMAPPGVLVLASRHYSHSLDVPETESGQFARNRLFFAELISPRRNLFSRISIAVFF